MIIVLKVINEKSGKASSTRSVSYLVFIKVY
jgi:hypothetical protein